MRKQCKQKRSSVGGGFVQLQGSKPVTNVGTALYIWGNVFADIFHLVFIAALRGICYYVPVLQTQSETRRRSDLLKVRQAAKAGFEVYFWSPGFIRIRSDI